MHLASPTAKYQLKMYRIQDYIGENISDSLTVTELADRANLSKFHFIRQFSTICNETPYQYIRRIRLEVAANQLKYSQSKILSIAFGCGFDNQTSFSKAFKQYFYQTPGQYRLTFKPLSNFGTSLGNPETFSDKPNGYISDSALNQLINRKASMNHSIENLGRQRIAYLRRVGPYGPENQALMQQLKHWAVTNNTLTEQAVIFGIALDNPEITPAQKCRYDCAITIPEGMKLNSEDINEGSIPEGLYGVFPVEHTAQEISAMWAKIFNQWLPESGYQLDNRPVLERYKANSVKAEPDSCELCIPLVRG